jgi:hypothetical protein
MNHYAEGVRDVNIALVSYAIVLHVRVHSIILCCFLSG